MHPDQRAKPLLHCWTFYTWTIHYATLCTSYSKSFGEKNIFYWTWKHWTQNNWWCYFETQYWQYPSCCGIMWYDTITGKTENIETGRSKIWMELLLIISYNLCYYVTVVNIFLQIWNLFPWVIIVSGIDFLN